MIPTTKELQFATDITHFTKYAKHIPELNRRENWGETCSRNMKMHLNKIVTDYDNQNTQKLLKDKLFDVYSNYVIPKKILPSMRSMQFAGRAIERSPNRIYNCAFLPIDSVLSFSETMYLLLGGTGVGYSVQKHHIEQLPNIKKATHEMRYVVDDTIKGWAEAVRVLIESNTGTIDFIPLFDLSEIRPKGSPLKTTGGKSPDPMTLMNCLNNISNIFNSKQDGEKLTPLESHDILCYIADAVLAGGIRRSAMIALFSKDDEEMIKCKSGEWWTFNEQRGKANNSAVLIRDEISEEQFKSLWQQIENSGSGEPAFYFSNNKEWGTNPCVEISLKPYSFCNLCECDVSNITDQQDLENRLDAATFLGTLQATYTDFHYLRPIWKQTTEEDALIGISMTGIANNRIKGLNLIKASDLIKRKNKYYAELMHINPAARTTCIKPAGTTSLIFGTSSGIHAWHSKYYIRRMRIGKDEPIYNYLVNTVPQLMECEINHNKETGESYNSEHTSVLSFPQKTPTKNCIVRDDETALDLLNRIKKVSIDWVRNGHNSGLNTNNVSATVSIRNSEWGDVGNWLWSNREHYNGIAILPYNGGTYKQAPFEVIDKIKFNKMMKIIDNSNFNLQDVIEEEDNTNLQGEIACAGGVCEI